MGPCGLRVFSALFFTYVFHFGGADPCLIAVGGSKPIVARLEVCHVGRARPLWGVTRACGAPMTARGLRSRDS